MITEIAVYNELLKARRQIIPIESIRGIIYTSSVQVPVQAFADWVDDNLLILSGLIFNAASPSTQKFDVTARTCTQVSTTVYTGSSGWQWGTRCLLRDRTGDRKLWMTNENPGDYGLYYYDGTTLTKKLSDSGIGYLAYGNDGFVYHKSSTGNYYKCYNGVVSVVSNPTIWSLSHETAMQPNGLWAGTNPGNLVPETAAVTNLGSESIPFGAVFTTNADMTNNYQWFALRNILGADDYLCVGRIQSDTTNRIHNIRLLLINKQTRAVRLLPRMSIGVYGTGAPVLSNTDLPVYAARFVAGSGLFVYVLMAYFLSGSTNYFQLGEIFYPMELNF
jgi:hypothetical protein